MNFEKFFSAYVECALWSSSDDADKPLDANYDIDDIDPKALEQMKADCKDFIESNAELLEGLMPEQCGHDFWLTRNGHGAGFWDRGLDEVGDKLTDACKPYGTVDLYVHEGKVYA